MPEPRHRIAAGDRYLDRGRLYVARFDADGSGEWIELTIADPRHRGLCRLRLCRPVRRAGACPAWPADAVGATKMDRPEWCAVNPANGEIYYTLTNNSNRKVVPASASQQGVGRGQPARLQRQRRRRRHPARPGNVNGHIIRLRENGRRRVHPLSAGTCTCSAAQADADPANVNLVVR